MELDDQTKTAYQARFSAILANHAGESETHIYRLAAGWRTRSYHSNKPQHLLPPRRLVNTKHPCRCTGCQTPIEAETENIVAMGYWGDEKKAAILGRFCTDSCFIRFCYYDSDMDREAERKEIERQLEAEITRIRQAYAPALQKVDAPLVTFCINCAAPVVKEERRRKSASHCKSCHQAGKPFREARFCFICAEPFHISRSENGAFFARKTCDLHLTVHRDDIELSRGAYRTVGGQLAAVRGRRRNAEGEKINYGMITGVGDMGWDNKGQALDGNSEHNLVIPSKP